MQFSRGLQIEKSLLAPTFYTDWLDRAILKVMSRGLEFFLKKNVRHNPHYEKMGLDERRETKDERDSNYKRHSREGGNLPPMLSKDEVPFEVPENWCWCRLGDICNKLIDGDHNPPKGLDYVTKYMML
jgi:hypothetical protein